MYNVQLACITSQKTNRRNCEVISPAVLIFSVSARFASSSILVQYHTDGTLRRCSPAHLVRAALSRVYIRRALVTCSSRNTPTPIQREVPINFTINFAEKILLGDLCSALACLIVYWHQSFSGIVYFSRKVSRYICSILFS
jgi:hypothetical protein